jgi:hypothetical protein
MLLVRWSLTRIRSGAHPRLDGTMLLLPHNNIHRRRFKSVPTKRVDKGGLLLLCRAEPLMHAAKVGLVLLCRAEPLMHAAKVHHHTREALMAAEPRCWGLEDDSRCKSHDDLKTVASFFREGPGRNATLLFRIRCIIGSRNCA